VRRLGSRLLERAPAIRCTRCGKPLFRAVPVVANGRLRLYGAERAVVRVEWTSRHTLAFRHEALDACEREITLPVERLGA
jgi:hypothetical protein